MKKSEKKRRDKPEVDGSQPRTTKTLSTGENSKKTVDQAVVPMDKMTKLTSDIGDNEGGASKQFDTLTVSETGRPVFGRETHTSDSQPGAFPSSLVGAQSMESIGTINIGSEMSDTDRDLLQTPSSHNRTPSDQSPPTLRSEFPPTLSSENPLLAIAVPYNDPPPAIQDNEGVPERKLLRELLKDRRIIILIASLLVVILVLVGTIVASVVTGGNGGVSGSTRLPVDNSVTLPPMLLTTSSSPFTEGAITSTTNGTSEPSTSPSTRTIAPTSQLKDIFEFIYASSFDQGLALQNISSPQYQSFEWLLAESEMVVYSRERLLQRYALNTFYYILKNTKSYQWRYLNQSDHECQWPLVYCNANGFVDAFVITGQIVHAMMPGEFGFLTDMTSLSLEGNKITGSLPSSLEKWTRLESFQASNNLLTGTFPEFFSRLPRLTNLDLSLNRFTGKLPSSMSGMSSLQKISIATNAFSGPIPSDLWTLTTLRKL